MKKNNKFVEEDNNDFYYMPISNDLIDYEKLPDKLAYDVENLSLFFTSAFDVKINITNDIENSPYCQIADLINSSANELFLKQIDEILYS